MSHDRVTTETSTCRLPPLTPITTPVRLPDEKLWALLTKPGPLSAAEWQLIDEAERAGWTDDDEAGDH